MPSITVNNTIANYTPMVGRLICIAFALLCEREPFFIVIMHTFFIAMKYYLNRRCSVAMSMVELSGFQVRMIPLGNCNL
jgi:hypothetical protein